MTEKFNNLYRIPSARLESFDYGSAGMYFITICTKNRKQYFGNIYKDVLNLSELGSVVNSEWLKSPEIRSDMNIKLGEFVVMPNHFHAVLTIGGNNYNTHNIRKVADLLRNTDCKKEGNPVCNNCGNLVCSGNYDEIRRDAMHCVSTSDTETTITTKTVNAGNAFQPQSKNLAAIIRGFKSAVTTYARKNNIEFNWQSRFHDHIIRSAADYDRISQYILNNPKNWKGK
jgi:REP element-mobilizing transposase RayT